MERQDKLPRWLKALSTEDLNFLKRFLLHSGSLKKIAAEYGVSYPTVRLRLDRLIQKVEVTEQAQQMSEFEQRLQFLLVDQKLDADTYREIMAAHQAEKATESNTEAT